MQPDRQPLLRLFSDDTPLSDKRATAHRIHEGLPKLAWWPRKASAKIRNTIQNIVFDACGLLAEPQSRHSLDTVGEREFLAQTVHVLKSRRDMDTLCAEMGALRLDESLPLPNSQPPCVSSPSTL